MQKMVEQVKQLFDYCATQEEAIITYLASKNESMHSQQRGILQQKERMKPSMRTFSPVEQQSIPTQQWCHIDKCDNHKSCHVLSS